MEVQGARLSAHRDDFQRPEGEATIVDSGQSRSWCSTASGRTRTAWPCDYVSELSVSVNHCLLVVAETAGTWQLAQLGAGCEPPRTGGTAAPPK